MNCNKKKVGSSLWVPRDEYPAFTELGCEEKSNEPVTIRVIHPGVMDAEFAGNQY